MGFYFDWKAKHGLTHTHTHTIFLIGAIESKKIKSPIVMYSDLEVPL